MDARLRWSCVTGVVLMLGVGTARGNIVNGDFSIPFGVLVVGWERFTFSDASGLATAEITGDRLHIVTTSTWTWDGSTWTVDGIDASYAEVSQDIHADDSGFYAPPGTTGLEFDVVGLSVTGDVPDNTLAGLSFQVTYRDTGGAVVAQDLNIPTGSYTHSIAMPGLVPDAGEMDIVMYAFSDVDTLLTPTPGAYMVTVEATLDRFEFVPGVIPEPVTLLTGTIAVALIGWVARRRVTGPPA